MAETKEQKISKNSKQKPQQKKYVKRTTEKGQKTEGKLKTGNTKRPMNKGRTRTTRTSKKPIKIIPLGGLGEIGKNITLYEYDGDMFLVDCGMAFPDEDMPGIDIVIPDFSYVLENRDKI